MYIYCTFVTQTHHWSKYILGESNLNVLGGTSFDESMQSWKAMNSSLTPRSEHNRRNLGWRLYKGRSGAARSRLDSEYLSLCLKLFELALVAFFCYSSFSTFLIYLSVDGDEYFL